MADIVKDLNITQVQMAEMNEDGTCLSANEQVIRSLCLKLHEY